MSYDVTVRVTVRTGLSASLFFIQLKYYCMLLAVSDLCN